CARRGYGSSYYFDYW
nr:immunoglobulin heavy chain junction region [Macaca mulatta]MOY21438.1 immunoglobulin heavy chain junction region [Macaca mulatta]MOY22425.1 immunoglobulin heavy chain junction region [Macaca mulatta]MOY23387.1 immunoglobulin heavy chain junction region [Macaca mulatta]MOY24513.1 immunoglobulin heavy chain junction region [Macaca mulatta]